MHLRGNVQRNSIAQQVCRCQVQEIFLTEKLLPFTQRWGIFLTDKRGKTPVEGEEGPGGIRGMGRDWDSGFRRCIHSHVLLPWRRRWVRRGAVVLGGVLSRGGFGILDSWEDSDRGVSSPEKRGGSDQDVGWWDERGGAAWAQAPKAWSTTRGVWGHVPQENFEILAPKSVDSEGIFMPSICCFSFVFFCLICRVSVLPHKCWIAK